MQIDAIANSVVPPAIVGGALTIVAKDITAIQNLDTFDPSVTVNISANQVVGMQAVPLMDPNMMGMQTFP